MRRHSTVLLHLMLLLMIVPCRPLAAERQPSFHVSHSGRFQFVADFRFTDSKKIGSELESLAERLWSELAIPDRRAPVRVYLFSTQREFAAYVRRHIPALRDADTNRTAMFLLRGGKPYIFAVATSELTLNLRHEFVHVLLNTTHKGLPIWLDEGLAEYYEVSDGEQPAFRKLLARQQRRFWKPDMPRLERLTTMSEMGIVEYAEGWCWVHLLMRGPEPARRVIPRYLSDLRKGAPQPPISSRVARSGIDAAVAWRRHLAPPPQRTASRRVR